jgi:hypothetical protein
MCARRDFEFHGVIGVNFNPDAPTPSTTTVLLISTTIFDFSQHRLIMVIIVSTRVAHALLRGQST